MAYFPLFMRADRLHVLVVGGGEIAAAKLETLAGCGADVRVVAKEVGAGVRALAERYGTRVIEAAYEAVHLEGRNLVVVATGDAATGAAIAAEARAKGIWVNVVDDPENCDGIFPAMLQRGAMQVAISSGGVSPVLARLLKQQIEQQLPEGLDVLASFMAANKDRVRARLSGVQPRRLFWERIVRGPLPGLLAEGRREQADAWFEEALSVAGDAGRSALYLLRVMSFAPDLVAVRALRWLGQADVIAYEGGRAMLPLLERYARRDAVKVALEPGDTKWQERVEGWLENGKILVHLGWAGDPESVLRREEARACVERLVKRQLAIPVDEWSAC